MSRILIDTHILLWALLEPARLSANAAASLRDPNTTVFVSAVSAWEIATKYRLGRLPHAGALMNAYSAQLERFRAEELPIRSAHALKAGALEVEHRDPFDRMLAAQAITEGLPLITNDVAFSRFPDVRVVW